MAPPRGGGGVERAGDAPALRRYDEAARLLTGEPNARAEDGVAWLEALTAELGIPPLAAYGVAEGDLPEVIAKARRSSSMQGNPIVLTDEELAEILRWGLRASRPR